MTRSVRRYFLVWLTLLALTALSYLTAQLSLGAAGTAVGLCIAAIKVTLVALYFMHLVEERLVLGLVAIAAALWVVLLCAGVAADVAMR